VACIGNAAQTLHPIAGQGYNLAFRDAWQLAEHLVNCFAFEQDPGEYKALSTYKKLRRKDRQQTVWFTDGLVRLFSNSNPLLQGGRNIGLLAMQNNASLKQQFARMAMGQKL
jgi:2-octaprenyl-6-methoxyphenol hydroxylase